MSTRKNILKQLWDENINSWMQENWVDNFIRESEKHPNAPFADLGPVLKRLLTLGVSRRELSLLARHASYESVFGTLYTLSDPGVDDNKIEMLHESLLSADPSGMDARPGSPPQKA